MAELKLDKGKTALLMADFHTDSMGENPIVRERQTFERAKVVLDAARAAGVFVAYIVVNFRPAWTGGEVTRTHQEILPPGMSEYLNCGWRNFSRGQQKDSTLIAPTSF